MRADPSDAPALRELLTELRVAPSAERPAESVHAVLHKQVKRAPRHGCADVSTANRYPEIKRFIGVKPDNFQKMVEYVVKITDGRTAVELLGLQNHPVSYARRRPFSPRSEALRRLVPSRPLEQIFDATACFSVVQA